MRQCPTQHLTTGINRNHLRLPVDEGPGRNPRVCTHIEHPQPVERAERVEYLIGIVGACSVILVGDRFERNHLTVITDSTHRRQLLLPAVWSVVRRSGLER